MKRKNVWHSFYELYQSIGNEELVCSDRRVTSASTRSILQRAQSQQRIQFVHTYMLACVWFIAQIFPMPLICERQINTAVTWFLQRGSIFRVKLSTIQRWKLQGGWNLINIGAESRSLLHFRIQTESTAQGTLTADWLRKWHLQTPGSNPPHIQRISPGIEYLRQYALNDAYITPQQENETSKAYKHHIYNAMFTLLRDA